MIRYVCETLFALVLAAISGTAHADQRLCAASVDSLDSVLAAHESTEDRLGRFWHDIGSSDGAEVTTLTVIREKNMLGVVYVFVGDCAISQREVPVPMLLETYGASYSELFPPRPQSQSL